MKLQRDLLRILSDRRVTKLIVLLLLVVVLSLALPADSQAVYFNRKLSGSMPEYGDASNWTGGESQISPDGSYVVFVADRATDEMVELYSVPLEGDELTRLNPVLKNGAVWPVSGSARTASGWSTWPTRSRMGGTSCTACRSAAELRPN